MEIWNVSKGQLPDQSVETAKNDTYINRGLLAVTDMPMINQSSTTYHL